MSHDIKVTATPAFPPISDRLTVRGPLAYTAWPGSPFQKLEKGDELFNLTEDYEKSTVRHKIYPRVRVTKTSPNEGAIDIDFEEVLT